MNAVPPDPSAPGAAADLDSCAREPIHIPGAIQPHGVLLVLREPDLAVVQASANTAAFFGTPAEALPGQPLDTLFDGVARLREWLPDQELDRPVQVPFSLAAPPLDAVVHRTDGGLVLELEPGQGDRGGVPVDLQTSLERLQRAHGLADLCGAAAREVRRLTGFDRVKVYRFDADWHGEVLAEDRAAHMESYLGLHFPASDVPEQARRLYTLNRLRLIPDVAYTPAPILPALSPATGAPLDLSFSTLRSVSPVHVEYLKNMGVGASMSISVVQDGRLWGLIACHHAGPLRVPYRTRVACELLGQVVALLLEATQETESRQQQARRREILAHLLVAMVRADDFIDGLRAHERDVLDLVGATGAAVLGQGRCLRLGATPDEVTLQALAAWLDGGEAGDLYHTDRLARTYPEAEAFQEGASGLLAITLSRLQHYAVLWFRPEVPQTVYWAGNPAKAVTREAGGGPPRLHPRRSFQAWKDTLRGRSLPWTAADVEAARALQRAISDVIFVKMETLSRLNASLETANTALTDANERLRREVAERQQAEAALEQSNRWLRQRNRELQDFAYVASHDLQEPLRKIRSFASLLATEYGEAFDAQGQHYLERMGAAAGRMSTLIADLLSFARVLTHPDPFEEVDLRQVVEWVCAQLEPVLTEAGARVEVGPLPRIEADRTQMYRLFHNLIHNAVKFRRPEVPPLVHVAGELVEQPWVAGAHGMACRITITDNGAGFDEKYLDRIFLPFQQLHPRGAHEGTGIGLAISKRIVERHGGTLTARSTPGHGSTFVVTLPVHPPRLAPADPA